MDDALAFSMLLMHQRQARSVQQQRNQQHLFLTFLHRELTAEEYERSLVLSLLSSETS